MTATADKPPTERPEAAEEPPKPCMLGRPLGDCSLRRAGCGSLYAVLPYLYPPQTLLAELRTRPQLDPTVATWLRKLETVTPTPRRSKADDRSAALLQLFNTKSKG
jgi:hypothetical protein